MTSLSIILMDVILLAFSSDAEHPPSGLLCRRIAVFEPLWSTYP